MRSRLIHSAVQFCTSICEIVLERKSVVHSLMSEYQSIADNFLFSLCTVEAICNSFFFNFVYSSSVLHAIVILFQFTVRCVAYTKGNYETVMTKQASSQAEKHKQSKYTPHRPGNWLEMIPFSFYTVKIMHNNKSITLRIHGIRPITSPFQRVPYPLNQELPFIHSIHIETIPPRIFVNFSYIPTSSS